MVALALLSDIHANLPALEAVAADCMGRRPDHVYVLGDVINGAAWPHAVMDFIAAAGWPVLLGNHDDAVLQLGSKRMEPRYADHRRYALLWWTRARLSAAHLTTLEGLPRELPLNFAGAAPGLRLVHGIPGNFFVGIRPDSPDDWVRDALTGVREPAVGMGHTHAPLIRRPNGWLVVNSGSVGAPYDGDWRPSYAWLEGDAHGWRAEIVRVTYDRAVVDYEYTASGLAREGGVLAELFQRTVMTGLPWVSDYAHWIRLQPADQVADPTAALRLYDAQHGPGRWAFPL